MTPWTPYSFYSGQRPSPRRANCRRKSGMPCRTALKKSVKQSKGKKKGGGGLGGSGVSNSLAVAGLGAGSVAEVALYAGLENVMLPLMIRRLDSAGCASESVTL